MSLLTICQSACARLALPIPTSIVANTSNAQAQTMYYLAQEEGKSLSRRAAWKKLIREQTFSTTAAAAQTGAIPSDCDWILPETMFNRTSRERICGPIDAEEWQRVQASVATHVDPLFRIRNTDLLITPTPAASETVAFEYITTKWCQSSGGTAQAAWAADTDTALVDEELHTLGLMWRFLKSRGLEYGHHIANYESQVMQAIMREGVRPKISTDGPWRYRRGADAIAGTEPNVIVTDGGDHILWD